ncbi:TonB-dependent receptor [Gracilimonas mengyeensis]|uniref:CarboxypepD_reg-like domain-containing protein n=1 Tax=Gracilimonas mengyeensis TaxID=1302730 RepID=A0A521FEB6_9BACT|nr:carboxypeptidase-like regulatory domain-containing protein [Gracilimonas mengyeensis]SMO93890.1 CarboxypepD_reg-like domain-containing protein [Gracilimonas mengyeensis]
MKYIIYWGTVIVCLFSTVFVNAQVPTQTIRGQVTDAASGSPLAGVSILLLESDPVKGTSTDANGRFSLHQVPVGRQTLRFSFVGYETHVAADIMVGSAREVVLNITMTESVTEMEEVVVNPGRIKNQPINAMAVSSARQLSMEEASRYAGGFDDPARLAASFAGVAGNLDDNALVIRGNAPKGMLWQMEGVEIPTPSHFANITVLGGGGITALSSQLVADSDFYTGAFPAEYGNALSGVFDLNLRNGNNRQYEHTVEAGIIGIDVASEGPIAGDASYLFNYRLSTFSLIAPLLPDGADLIRYQNLSYKINVPTRKAGTFSLWGIGANDYSGGPPEDNPEDWTYHYDREDVDSPTAFGAAGFKHRLLLGKRAYLSTSLVGSGSGFNWNLDRYTEDGSTLYPREYIRSRAWKITAKSVLNTKVSGSHTNRSGALVNRLSYRQESRYSDDPSEPMRLILDETGHSYLYQAFTQSRFDFGKFLITGGFHLQHFELTNATSLEPRLAVQFKPNKNSFSLAYGRHSQVEPLSIYFAHPDNRSLTLTKADHFVAGYSRSISENLFMNLEFYYQWLSHVPVIPDSSFSALNMEEDWFLEERMENDGVGENYGVDFTLERNLSNGWYGLFAGSLFESRYKGGDQVWRNTRFDRGYLVTLLGGKEWEFRDPDRVRYFSINARLNMMGGKRISPVDRMRTFEEREVFYDEYRAYANQEPDVVFGDITLEYRKNKKNIATVWALQVINVSGYQQFYGYVYNLKKERIEDDREAVVVPNLSYRIEF